MNEVFFGVLCFLVLQFILVTFIVVAKKTLLPGGEVSILINDEKKLIVEPGGKLLSSLAAKGIFLSSACGGGGSCGQCRCVVEEGGGAILPTELSSIKRSDAKAGVRLSCQVPVKRDMKISVPSEMLETKKWHCRVGSNKNVATFIKELILDLPAGEDMNFKSGGYVQIEVPPHVLNYKSFDIDEKFLGDWTKFKMFQYTSKVSTPVTRAYSMANYPGEKGIIKLNIRIASPPPRGPLGTPPGQVSSYIFSLKAGDDVTISGPFGEFYIEDSESEMIYIGGGAGMAPLRSHIFELFKGRKTNRKVSFWYGGRSRQELFYMDEFEELAEKHDNFKFCVSLSNPLPDDNWEGETGFIHTVLCKTYLDNHEAPEDINYYLCGPPVMTCSILEMLDNLGVEPENIHYDDFGS